MLTEFDFERFNVCVNEEITSEYTEQIYKKILNPKYILNEKLFEKFFRHLHKFEKVSDLKVSRDPKDDKFINCAIDA